MNRLENLIGGDTIKKIKEVLPAILSGERLFLEESNSYEDEHSTNAFVGALLAWDYAKRHRNERITPQYVKDIHFIFMHLIYQDGGEFRTVPIYVGSKEDTYSPEKVDDAMKEWCERFNDPKTSEEEIRQEHIKFLKIHPFEDGNGRTARILMNIQRLKAGHGLLIVTKNSEYDEGRGDYEKWFD